MSEINSIQLDALVRFAAEVPPGTFVEFGVYRGGSAERLAAVVREQGRRLFLFDTFTGIPERTDGVDLHQVGDFSRTSLWDVVARVGDYAVEYVIGDIRETFGATETGPVAFAHVDVDQYVTTRFVVSTLLPRMVRGGIIWLDDYRALDGATKAVDELGLDVVEHPCGKFYVRT